METRGIVVQQIQGAPTQEQSFSSRRWIGVGQSNLWNTNVSYKNGICQTKCSDDQIIIGYTVNGLPYQIVVGGSFDRSIEKASSLFLFIEQQVTLKINQYAANLSNSTDAKKTIGALIQDIYALRKKYAPLSEFTLSVAITYEKNGELYCAGFGIGNCGLVLRESSGIVPLAYSTLIQNKQGTQSKDAISDYHERQGIAAIIARNSLFDRMVSPGDELLGYTDVHSELLSIPNRDESKNDITIIKSTLNTSNLPKNNDLFTAVRKANETQCSKQARCPKEFSYDHTLGIVVIPSAKQRQAIRSQMADSAIHLQQRRQIQMDLLQHELKNLRAEILCLQTEKQLEFICSKALEVHKTISAWVNVSTNPDATTLTPDELFQLRTYVNTVRYVLCDKPEIRRGVGAINACIESARAKPSKGWQAIGIAMIGLGIAVITAGIFAAMLGFMTLPLIPFTLSAVVAVLSGAGSLLAGGALVRKGYRLFACPSETPASKVLAEFAEAYQPKLK